MASYQYVYVMKDLTKNFPGGREVFKGITLSFLPGVKIGILGVNGAGKSTLMKIVAGLTEPSSGEIQFARGAKASYLPQDGIVTTGRSLFHEARAALAELLAMEEELHRIGQDLERPRLETPCTP